jgi:hypothetical protein
MKIVPPTGSIASIACEVAAREKNAITNSLETIAMRRTVAKVTPSIYPSDLAAMKMNLYFR